MSEPNAWRIEVTVPLSLPDEQRQRLMNRISTTVIDWEPADRDGWDTVITAGAITASEEDAP